MPRWKEGEERDLVMEGRLLGVMEGINILQIGAEKEGGRKNEEGEEVEV